ncbi:MAG: hypothetical protein AAGA58_09505 [Verrucomicrobiota bacterium]
MNHQSSHPNKATVLRRWFGLFGVTMATLGLLMLFSPKTETGMVSEDTVQNAFDAPDTTAPPEEVFKRAFWRKPTGDDEILHAERREWSDGNGVRKWQWFLKVRPSDQLVEYLRDQNAFHLVSAPTIAPIPNPPSWFAPQESNADVFQSTSATMQLVFGTDDILYATDRGGGFHLGAELPAGETEFQVASTGRLPQHSPPDPRSQK